MILTNCAACAAPLPRLAKQCSRCQTRYCGATCQQDHWRRGHKQMCKKIHRGGNAEKYYADKKYKEAVAEAVEACAADMKGHRCYICMDVVHPRTGEGLVRGCACGDRERYVGGVPTGTYCGRHIGTTGAVIEEAPESVPTTDILVKMSKINFNYAICLWKYHFYGYDSYRDDLRNSIEILEHIDNYPDTHRPAGYKDALICIRNEQLDWCIHDLTPATFQAYRHL